METTANSMEDDGKPVKDTLKRKKKVIHGAAPKSQLAPLDTGFEKVTSNAKKEDLLLDDSPLDGEVWNGESEPLPAGCQWTPF
jgi:hypothetical protein